MATFCFLGNQRHDGDCRQESERLFARVWRRRSAFATVALRHLFDLPADVVFIRKVGLLLREVELPAMEAHQPTRINEKPTLSTVQMA